MKTSEKRDKKIIIRFTIEGLHNWPDCDTKKTWYLKHVHRHMFHVEMRKKVTENNREIEIIEFRNDVLSYLKTSYFDKKLDVCNFGKMSCEDIAEDLLETYNCCYVKVLEDNENGALITL